MQLPARHKSINYGFQEKIGTKGQSGQDLMGSPSRTLGCTQKNSDPGGLTAPQLDARPIRHKIFSFIDTSQNNNEDSVKNPNREM